MGKYTTIVDNMPSKRMFLMTQCSHYLFLFTSNAVVFLTETYSFKNLAMLSVLIAMYTLVEVLIIFLSNKIDTSVLITIFNLFWVSLLVFIDTLALIPSSAVWWIGIYTIIWGGACFFTVFEIFRYMKQKHTYEEKGEYIDHIPLQSMSLDILSE